MTNYQKVETCYKKYHDVFKYFEQEFYKKFDIPEHIIRDTIKGYLVQIVCDQGASAQLLKKRNIILSVFLYPMVFFYFAFLSFLGSRSNKVKIDILYEEWNSIGTHFKLFYNPIYERLLNKRQAIFSVTKEKDINFKIDIKIIQKYTKLKFEKEISKKILERYFFNFFNFFNFSIRHNFDFLGLSLRILKSIAKYETESKNIKSEFLVTACDNGYNALRYYIYRKNGIKNIISIQNGARGDNTPSGSDMYLYSDYYFSYGKEQARCMRGLVAKEIIYSGSLPLYVLYRRYLGIEKKYDIILIEQMDPVDIENSYKITVFKQIIEHLRLFALKHKYLKVAYRVRKKRELLGDDYFLILDKMLKNSNIIFESAQSRDSYEAIMKSDVVINYCSSLGFEAMGMNKKVLTCNYDKLDFLPIEDSPAIVLENDYTLFERKLLYLLKNDYSKFVEIYRDLKLKYMNLSEDPTSRVLNIVNNKLVSMA